MKLPISLGEKKAKEEYYLSLILRNEKAVSVIFEKIGDSLKYINHAEEYFHTSIEEAEEDEFLTILDKSITQAETALPQNIETHKTLLALKESWIEEDKIKKEYLDKLKKASQELSLNPVGFLAFTESIINYIQKEEGAPLTAILADVGKKYISISFIKGGKIIESKTSEIHESASFTVDALLKHLKTPEVLPTKLVILDSEEDELTQEFIGHQWSKSLPFLHLPQIDSLPEDTAVKAVLLGAATQMNAQISFEGNPISTNEDDKPKRIEPESIENEESSEKKDEPVEGEETKNEPPIDEKAADFFGFVEGSDVASTPLPKETNKEVSSELREEAIEEAPEEVKVNEEKKFPSSIILMFQKLLAGLPVIIASISKIRLNKEFIKSIRSGNKLALGIPAALIFILLIVFYFYLFKTSANVNIIVAGKEEQKSTSVTFSSASSTDIENSLIAAQSVSVTEEGEASIDTTGKKDVGDPAKGTVTIFNNGSSSITFSSGTTITSSNDLDFTINKSVTVASASGDIFSGTKPGTANVEVTASEIGQEYNLPSNTKFTIDGNSNVAAKNDNAFSGGTKKTVTVVSADDLDKLLEELPKKLEDKAREDLSSKSSVDRTILSTFVDENVESKSFDKKENDEAKKVTLRGTVSFKAISYSNEDILKLAGSLFNTEMGLISKDNLEVNAKNIIVEKNKDVSSDLTLKAKILPKIDNVSLAKEISGNSIQKAKNIVSNIDQVESVEISLSPNIPFLPKNLPGNTKRINIKVTSN